MRWWLLAIGWCAWASIGAQAQPRAVTFALLPAPAASVPGVVATWAANAPADLVTGYRLSYGTAPGSHPTTIDAGNVLTLTVTGLTPSTPYYFVLVAYDAAGLVSGPSAEVSIVTAPAIDPNCVFPLGADVIQVFPTALQMSGSGGAGSKARLDFQVGSPGSQVVTIAVQSGTTVLGSMAGTNLGALAGIWFTVPSPSGVYPLSIAVNNAYGCPRVQSTSFSVTVP